MRDIGIYMCVLATIIVVLLIVSMILEYGKKRIKEQGELVEPEDYPMGITFLSRQASKDIHDLTREAFVKMAEEAERRR
jgi:uncharacterized membrane protein